MATQTPQKPPRYSAGKRGNMKEEDDDIEIIENDREVSQSLSHASSDIDIYGTVKDSPFTPFADKSTVFSQMMGTTDEMFKNVPQSSRFVKKRLSFDANGDGNGDGDEDEDNYNKREVSPIAIPMMSFRIKWRYNDGFHNEDARFVDIEASRMDRAVRDFMKKHETSTVKLMSVKLVGII